jgi:hypothetical protein
MAIHSGTSVNLFYKGVRVSNAPPCLFTYNAIGEMGLTEDRTLSDSYGFRNIVAKTLLTEVDDKALLRQVLLAKSGLYEHDLDFHWTSLTASEAFLKVVGELVQDKLLQVNTTAVRVWKDATQLSSSPKDLELTNVQQKMLIKATAFCEGIGFDVTSYPIRVVEALGHGGLGLAQEGEILIAEAVLHQGTKQLAATLIEEYIHLKHEYGDLTRELQTYLFDRVVSLGEELRGEPL